MESPSKNVIFFLHLNNNTMESGAIPIYINPILKKPENPSLLCKMKNKFYKTVYAMYLLNLPEEYKDDKLSLVMQLKANLSFPFEINIQKDYFEKEKTLYYFHFEKIIFKERVKNGLLDIFLNIKNKNLNPPFSCDINIFEQAQLILAYINNNQKRKIQFDILNSLKHELGFSKFSRLNDLFLIYLKIIFVDNYNIQLIQELLDNYQNIYFDIKNSFNFSLFFDTVIKPIFLKTYTNRNYIIYNNFEYDLRNCLNDKYNKIFDKLCFKYYIFYDKEFIMKENNIKSRISTTKQKYKFYEAFHEVLSELNINIFNNFFLQNKLLSEIYLQSLIEIKKKEVKIIKEKGINNNSIDVNNFNGLKIYELERYSEPIYFLGKLNNGCSILSIGDKELYLYDHVLNIKIRVQYQLSHNATSLYQLQDGNIILVFSNHQRVCIIDTKNIFTKLEQIYSFDKINLFQNEENILKVIELKNKHLVILSKNCISFYYNKIKSNENSQLYDYQKYSDIIQEDNTNNFSILEFNDNYIIVCSAKFKSFFSNDCYIKFINIKIINENSFQTDYSIHKINGLIVNNMVFEDNNILVKIGDNILGIGGINICLYSLKYKEIFQIVEIPSISYQYYYKFISSFLLGRNQILYIAVKYFLKNDSLDEFITKFFIYAINDNNYLNNDKEELIFLSESKANSLEEFFKATEIQY